MMVGLIPSSETSLGILAVLGLAAAGAEGWRLWRQRRATVSQAQPCVDLVRAHFKPLDPQQLSTVHRIFPLRMKADLQLTLNAAIAALAPDCRYVSMRAPHSHIGIDFNALLNQESHYLVRVATPQFEEVDVGADEPIRCLTNGLWVAQSNGTRFILLLAPADRYGEVLGLRVEIATPSTPAGERLSQDLFKRIEDGVARAGSYRGKVVSLEISEAYSGRTQGLKVHQLHPVSREQLILPRATLAALDRNIVSFVQHRAKLVAAGLPAKKGILLYGPPGTGKTHTLHYLAHVLKGHTFLLVTAEQQGKIGEYITLARLLQPSVMVMEDADLIAMNREDMDNPCMQALLNKLLNEMDGLRTDAEILFILTTNRPEILEEALVARPGRIDQAIEIPRPDAECRRRLVHLYAGRLKMGDELVEKIVDRTAGVSAAFIKELVRRAAQYSIERGSEIELEGDDIEKALQDLLHSGGPLSAKLVGATSADDGAGDDEMCTT